jgi:hypothetical protein
MLSPSSRPTADAAGPGGARGRHMDTYRWGGVGSSRMSPRGGRGSAAPGVPSGLAARQAALVAALVAGGPDPEGFDPARLAATRRALLRKRAGEAAREWPVLAASLGPRWVATVADHHAARPPGGALRDGWDVARALRAQLTPDAAAELAEREARWRYDGAHPPRPRRLGRVRAALRDAGR